MYAPRKNGFKKKRSSAKRANRRGGRKTANFTSLNIRGTTIGFRGRKVSRRAFKKHLWDSTLFKTHYRSLLTTASNVILPTNDVQSILFGLNMIRHTSNPFWTVAGGCLPSDTGVAVPTFIGDVILRGGVYTVTFFNDSPNEVKIKLWESYTVADPVLSILPVLPSTAWDPSATADFNAQIGKPYSNKTVLMDSNTSYTYSSRFNVQKIDPTTYTAEGRSPIIWVSIYNCGNSVANTVRVVREYNLSFSADAQ